MILGRGAFGTVYKGVLQNGHQVAVKRANSSSSHEMFDKELELLGRANHSCLVNLMGYCQEDKLLVFEFMARGTLLENISSCEWISRMRIAAQAARGLEYLHRYASPSIIHRDVKTANILLDRDWNAHVSDFGLACVDLKAARGYLDPEYGLSSKITAKSDVYSFGVVLLELLSGQKPVDSSRKFQSLVAWVLNLVERREWSSVLVPSLPAPLQPEPLYRAVKLALECSKFASKQRPFMTLVAKRLEEIVEAMAGAPLLSISS
ncbi:LOW QUALITY PROTEIN: serine/threonine-protein kinase-like protein ACR4 [Selaginella moellendorffii]|uniref:LOW QUALITY PROTEIN: serine/threonine-protein kinase-like protein ACR4 n=1 Tax=Selaginella moellendorffii TaxID=88036 RepID=UPI000D1CA18D|nr:LOW QUALITY PROTEIN: serine/threonine-protein kinase-like protein ACR4 [Selaginella moellendorffii]|eukprot:XP_024537354.1 LOW QUALITY PROTEIN: serine/threonine-protein kinase-like protein ACR4 [Selaginella moellendorffii]